MKNPVRLTKAQIQPASQVLAGAFQDDALFAHLIPDTSQRKKKLPHFLETAVRSGFYYGKVYTTSAKLEGIAVWLSPGNTDLSLGKQIRAGMFSLIFRAGWKVISRAQSAMKYISEVQKQRAPFPHWYLFLLAVNPAFQGKGHASRLLKPMLTGMDEEHLPCYLETENPKSLPIYQHYGFKVVQEAIIPGTEVRQWAMLRGESP